MLPELIDARYTEIMAVIRQSPLNHDKKMDLSRELTAAYERFNDEDRWAGMLAVAAKVVSKGDIVRGGVGISALISRASDGNYVAEVGMSGYTPAYLEISPNRADALKNATEYFGQELNAGSLQELTENGRLFLSAESFVNPEFAPVPTKRTSIWYIIVREATPDDEEYDG